MKVTSATFEPLAEPPIPEWIVRVIATGTGFQVRSIGLRARVGDVPVEGLLEDDDLLGFSGYLGSIPPDGAHLFAGYAGDLTDTGITFEAPPIV